MHLNKVPFSDTNAFSDFFLDYVHNDERLRDMYSRFPEPESFHEQILEKQRSFSQDSREVLVTVLTRQYDSTPRKQPVADNIERLRHPNPFTVVTGHQLNICTGPL